MKFKKSDVSFQYTKGTGPGGQHKNKTESCVIATHDPTGLQIKIDGRKQGQNKKKALKELEKLYLEFLENKKKETNKEERDFRIKNTKTIRTYDYKKQTVKDHRSKKTAPLSKFLSGKIDLENFSQKD